MSKKIWLIFCCFPLFGQAQDLITGQVLDALTGKAIVAATVVHGASRGETDSTGHFSLKSGSGRAVEVSAFGYTTASQPLGVAALLFRLQPLANELQEVVVSGNLRAMTRLQSPVPVEVYNQKFLTRNVTANIFEALTMANGIQPQMNCNVCNTGDIHINGLEGPYTMVLIDGMPIVSSLSTVYGLMGIPNSMIKRIEVVKGPASTLYGSEAVGGLINIITRDAPTSNLFTADINHTSYAETNVDAGYGFSGKKVSGFTGLNVFNYTRPFDKNNDGFTDVTLQQRVSLFQKLSFARPDGRVASMGFRGLVEDRWGGQLSWDKSMQGSDSLYGERIRTQRLEWIGQYSLSRNILAEASYNYHFQDSYYGTTWYKAQQHTAFAQLRWQRQVGNHMLTAGIPFRMINYDDNTPATQKPDGSSDADVQTMAGAFVQTETSFGEKLTMLAGLRYEHHNIQGSVLSPRLALKYALNGSHVLRLSGGNGFRVVNLFTEDHAALSGFREVVITEDLLPERSWNANLNYTGTLHLPTAVLTIDASAFYTYFTNKIVPDYDTDPNKIIYANLDGFGVSRGLSLNADLLTRRNFRASLGITVMDVFNEERNADGQMERLRQIQAPVFSGTYALGYTIRRWGTLIDLTGRVNGPMRLPILPNDFRPEYSPWFTLANIQVTQPISPAFEVYVGVKNLLDYFPRDPLIHPDDPFDKPGGLYWLNDGTPNPVTNPNGFTFDPSYNYAPLQGRRVMLGLRWRIGK